MKRKWLQHIFMRNSAKYDLTAWSNHPSFQYSVNWCESSQRMGKSRFHPRSQSQRLCLHIFPWHRPGFGWNRQDNHLNQMDLCQHDQHTDSLEMAPDYTLVLWWTQKWLVSIIAPNLWNMSKLSRRYIIVPSLSHHHLQFFMVGFPIDSTAQTNLMKSLSHHIPSLPMIYGGFHQWGVPPK